MATPNPIPVLRTASRSAIAPSTSANDPPEWSTRWRVSSAIIPALSREARGTTTRSGVRNSVRSTGDPRRHGTKLNHPLAMSTLLFSGMPATAATSPALLDLSPSEALAVLQRWVPDQELPAYRARQIHRRLWRAPVREWAAATEL